MLFYGVLLLLAISGLSANITNQERVTTDDQYIQGFLMEISTGTNKPEIEALFVLIDFYSD